MRKYLLPLLMLCMIIMCIPCTTPVEAAESTCIIRGEELYASPNSEVTMELTIENNPGIIGAEIIVSFDERLSLVDAESGNAFSALTYVSPSYYRNPTIFVWDAEKINDEDIKDGVILRLTFRTPDQIEGSFPVTITYESGNIFGKDLKPIELTTVNGRITPLSYLPGDADGNKRINTLDITAIRRYISDGRTTDPNGYNVVIHENAADVDGNGRINTLDITLIRRYISDGRVTDPNGYNIVLKPGQMSHAHNMIHTAAKTPTCTDPGNIEYWQCNSCGKYFADADGKYEILFENAVIPASHTFETKWTYDEYSHWHTASCEHKEQLDAFAEHSFVEHKCSVCGATETVTVSFVDYTGSVIDMQLLPYGAAATAPSNIPERSGYIFDGWSASFDSVTEDMTISAKYAKAYTVTFVDYNGSVLKQESVRSGSSAAEYEFTESDLPPEGYTRTGWDKSFDSVTEDITVCATYEKICYTVSFYMPDKTTLIEEKTVEHGADVEAPIFDDVVMDRLFGWENNPNKFIDRYFDWENYRMCSFSGWSRSLKNITSDVSVYAQYQNDFEQPVISIDTTSTTASIRLYAPKNCYIYAMDFGFEWDEDVSIAIREIPENDAIIFNKNEYKNCNYSNKDQYFRYTWAKAEGLCLTKPYADIVEIKFYTSTGDVVSKDVLNSPNDWSIVFSLKENALWDELQTITPIIVIK